MQFDGEFEVKKTRDEVYRFLSDPQKFGPLLPGYQSLEPIDDKTCSVKLKVGVPQIPGSATVKLSLDEDKAPERALYSGKGQMPGGSMNLTAGFDLAEGSGGGTKVQWHGEVKIAGRLASLAGGLLKPLAKKNIETLIGSLQQKLS